MIGTLCLLCAFRLDGQKHAFRILIIIRIAVFICDIAEFVSGEPGLDFLLALSAEVIHREFPVRIGSLGDIECENLITAKEVPFLLGLFQNDIPVFVLIEHIDICHLVTDPVFLCPVLCDGDVFTGEIHDFSLVACAVIICSAKRTRRDCRGACTAV